MNIRRLIYERATACIHFIPFVGLKIISGLKINEPNSKNIQNDSAEKRLITLQNVHHHGVSVCAGVR